MRPRYHENPVEWMLCRTVEIACRAMDGSPNELSRTLERLPHYSEVLEEICKMGEVGRLFLRMLQRFTEDIHRAPERGKMRAITSFTLNPMVLRVHDIVPVNLEVLTVCLSLLWKRPAGDYYDYLVEEGFSETACSAQRSSMGALLLSDFTPDMVLFSSPGACDSNAAAFAFLAARLKVPHCALDYPHNLGGEAAREYHRRDLLHMMRFLEGQTGKKTDWDRVASMLEETRRQDLLIAEIDEYQRLKPNPMPGIYNFLMLSGRVMFDGDPDFTRLLKAMAAQVRNNALRSKCGLSSGKERTRALMAYLDHYTYGFRFWKELDSLGVSQLVNVFCRCTSEAYPYGPGMGEGAYHIDTQSPESTITSLAEINARMPMIRFFRGPFDAAHMWQDELLYLAEMYSADCVLYLATPGCRNSMGMVKLMESQMEKRGIPTFVFYSDSFDPRVESWGVTTNRLEEFLTVRGLGREV